MQHAMRSRVRMTRALTSIFLTLSLVFAGTLGRAQNADTEKKINDTLSKLTLEEKIDLLSGATMMKTRAIPRVGIPSFGMSDGPSGAHVPAPSTAFAAGIGLAASWWNGWRGCRPTRRSRTS